jgi:subtilisin family serine protease
MKQITSSFLLPMLGLSLAAGVLPAAAQEQTRTVRLTPQMKQQIAPFLIKQPNGAMPAQRQAVAPRQPIAPAPLLPDLMIFLVAGTDAQAFAREYGLTIVRQFKSDPDAYVFRAASPELAGNVLRRIAPTEFQSMEPQRHPNAAADPRVRFAERDAPANHEYHWSPNDLLYFANVFQDTYRGQWHLRNEFNPGRDIHVVPAWDRGLTGDGVTVGVVDDAVQTGHPDWGGNISLADCWDFRNNDNLPDPPDNSEPHGTPVAGLIAARGGNDQGVTGVAPYAKMGGIRLGATLSATVDATLFRSSGANTNIKLKNHSYGYTYPFLFAAGQVNALRTSTNAGTIHVFSAGNYRNSGIGDSNRMLVQQDPESITVAAMNADGVASSYSNFGACITVTAPSNGTSGWGIASMDLVGSNGYNGMTVFDIPIYTDYTNQFGGTSAAAPIVTGALTLAKQAQPLLNRRLVKHLLARTSIKIDGGEINWTTNAAGVNFNPSYGFGLINTNLLTAFAPFYPSVSPLTTEGVPETAVNAVLPDNDGTALSRTFTINSTTPLEEVQIGLRVTTANANHIGAILVSPRGTSAWLAFPSVYNTDGGGNAVTPVNINWVYNSNAYWGENPQGTWTLIVGDLISGTVGTWNSFSVTMRMGQLEEKGLYVDKAAIGAEFGSQSFPFHSVTAALNAVLPTESARIYVKAGNYGSDRPRVTKRVQFRNWGNSGQARIGKP